MKKNNKKKMLLHVHHSYKCLFVSKIKIVVFFGDLDE